MNVIKSDGSFEEFDEGKIKRGICEAYVMASEKKNMEDINAVVDEVKEKAYDLITAQELRRIIEDSLVKRNFKAGRQYILYWAKKEATKQFVIDKERFIARYKASYNNADATVDDNSNVNGKNISLINAEIHKTDNILVSRGMITRKLSELYPKFNCRNYVKDLEKHIIYKNDESSFTGAIAPYCCSISMYPFLINGIENVGGLSVAPRNLDSFCGMYCNLLFAVASQFAGAVATSEALVFFDYFARKEFGEDYYKNCNGFYKIGNKFRKLLNGSHYWTNDVEELRGHDFGSEELNKLRDELVYESERPLTDEELKEYSENVMGNPNYTLKLGDGTRTIRGQIHQYFQQIVYTANQPAASRNGQSCFLNFSYFDKPFFNAMFENFYFPDGTRPLWDSINWIQKDFMMWFNEERLRCLLTFPVESFALIYKDGKFVDEENARFVADELERGHSFFIYISDTADSLSSCCRLKNKIQTNEFNFTNGNMGVETGSKSVITLNLSRITQDFCKKEFGKRYNFVDFTEDNIQNYRKYLVKILERVYKYHNAYNELLWDMYEAKLLPVYTAGFIDLNKQYLTIGINGLNQAAEFLGLECHKNEPYSEFCRFIFGTIKDENEKHKTKKTTFNTEQVPAESLAIKNYNWDKEDGYWVPEDTNLYASYIFKPNDDDSVLDKLYMMSKNFATDMLDGGAAAHINLSEHLSSKQYYSLLEYAAKVGCSYWTVNVPNAKCECGFITKHPITKCPKCGSEHIEYYDRVIGYLTKIRNWSEGRRAEQKKRCYLSEDKVGL